MGIMIMERTDNISFVHEKAAAVLCYSPTGVQIVRCE